MKMTMDERSSLLKIVNTLLNAGLAAALDDEKSKYGLYHWYRDAGLKDFGISYADGATKAVFIDSELDWVIKVSLRDTTRNYCAREYENYCLAEEAGLDYYFAACDFLAEIDGIAFYAQEYVECDDGVDSTIYESLRASYEDEGSEYNDEDLWCEAQEIDGYDRIMVLYGNRKLAKFIDEHHINDLHCGNFGIAGDHYVMIDYSGYNF